MQRVLEVFRGFQRYLEVSKVFQMTSQTPSLSAIFLSELRVLLPLIVLPLTLKTPRPDPTWEPLKGSAGSLWHFAGIEKKHWGGGPTRGGKERPEGNAKHVLRLSSGPAWRHARGRKRKKKQSALRPSPCPKTVAKTGGV